MTDGHESHSIGEQLATESVKQVVSNMEAYCASEQQVIELRNDPSILALTFEAQLLREQELELVECLRHTPPIGSLRVRRVKAIWYWMVAVVLTSASCYLTFFSLEPFRIGTKALLYCVGVAAVTPFALGLVLERWNTERIFKWSAAVACVAALAGVLLLALVRGNILMQQFENATPAVIIDDQQPVVPQPETDFYGATLSLLTAFMFLLTLAMELGAGLAMHEGWRMIADDSEEWQTMRQQLEEIRRRMKGLIFETRAMQVESPRFAAEFYRDFYRAMLTNTVRSAIKKLTVILVCALAVSQVRATAMTQLNLVIAVDLTKSVDVRGPDEKTEFHKNIDAVGNILAQIPADTKLTIIGITDASFSQPSILLSATVPADNGYFGERLKAARWQLVNTWKSRSRNLQPIFPRTDIIGALMLSNQMFEEQTAYKALIIFSDMRNDTADLDLASPTSIEPYAALLKAKTPLTGLQGAEVFLLGVDNFGKTITYWENLRTFWQGYFHNSKADLLRYTGLRILDMASWCPELWPEAIFIH